MSSISLAKTFSSILISSLSGNGTATTASATIAPSLFEPSFILLSYFSCAFLTKRLRQSSADRL